MAEKHPYTSSGAGAIVQLITQLRKAFPAVINAETLKKLSIAPNNETYLISMLRFLKLIDENGKKTNQAVVFFKADDADFQKGFSELIESAYSELFALHPKAAWTLPSNALVAFFRNHDHTSLVTGQRQALTFRTLAGLGGHGDKPASPKQAAAKTTTTTTKKAAKATPRKSSEVEGKENGKGTPSNGDSGRQKNGDVGLTVRIEINLPAGGDQDTYDRIFKSIRENLLRGDVA